MMVFATLHGVVIVVMIISSIASRKLAYALPEHKHPRILRRYLSSMVMLQESRHESFSAIVRPFRRVFGHHGFFGIKSLHFVTLFHTQQLVQAVFRAYQAAQLSALVPRMTTVWSYAVLVVAHCWSSPVIHRLCKHSPGLERLFYVLPDVFLAFITTIVIPSFLAVKYVKLYDRKTTSFPAEVFNDNVVLSGVVVELQHILVALWTDLITRIVMCISILVSVTDATVLLRSSQSSHHNAFVRSTAGPGTDDVKGATIIPISKRSMTPVLQLMIFTVGTIVFSLQLVAQLNNPGQGCMLPVHPWASPKLGYSFLMLNCTMEGVKGSKEEIMTILASYDAGILQFLETNGCPELSMPPYIQKLHRLSRLIVKSSRVIEWRPDAAVTGAYHKNLVILQAELTHLPHGQISPGMVDRDFPRSVHLVNLYAGNLVDLPLSVATLWPQGGMLVYAQMGATRLPDVIFDMTFYHLSLAGNQLSEIPVKLFYTPYLAMLDLTGNPLTSLPEVPQSMISEYGPPGATMQNLDVSYTGLQELPSWFGTRPIRLVALNTPLWVKLKAGDPTIPTNELIKQLVV